MKRFVKIYVTLFIFSVVITNLVMILLYGRQFLWQAAGDELVETISLGETLLLINAALVGLFVFLWWLARSIYRSHPPQPY